MSDGLWSVRDDVGERRSGDVPKEEVGEGRREEVGNEVPCWVEAVSDDVGDRIEGDGV